MASIIAIGFGSFTLMLLTQLVLWRVMRVRREVLWLLLLYLVLPTLFAVVTLATGQVDALSLFAIGLLHLALAGAYIQTYPALRENIPSFRILLLIDRHAHSGVTAEQVIDYLRSEGLFDSKIDDLVNDGFATKMADGRLMPTRYGAWLADVFRLYRKLLGLQTGHG